MRVGILWISVLMIGCQETVRAPTSSALSTATGTITSSSSSNPGSGTPNPSPSPSSSPAPCYQPRPTGVLRPARICGQAGYQYLHAMYVKPMCSGCHFTGSRLHPIALADRDVSVAYFEALKVTPESFVQRTLSNEFLPHNCWIYPGDPLRADVVEWAANRLSCPEP